MNKTCRTCKKEFISKLRSKLKNIYFKSCLECLEIEAIKRKERQNKVKIIITEKICRICLKTLPISCFYKHRVLNDGYRNNCIQCHSKSWKSYYNNGYNIFLKKKLKEDKMFQKTQNLKSILHYHLKSANLVKSNKTLNYIGCNKNKLQSWFIFQNNHWYYKIYHIDHILPISLFNLNNNEEQEIAFHWTNLQPLFGTENNSKYNKIRIYEYFNKLIQVYRFNKLSTNDKRILRNRHIWFKSYCNTFKMREDP